jgi:hypothetical protein
MTKKAENVWPDTEWMRLPLYKRPQVQIPSSRHFSKEGSSANCSNGFLIVPSGMTLQPGIDRFLTAGVVLHWCLTMCGRRSALKPPASSTVVPTDRRGSPSGVVPGTDTGVLTDCEDQEKNRASALFFGPIQCHPVAGEIESGGEQRRRGAAVRINSRPLPLLPLRDPQSVRPAIICRANSRERRFR